MPKLTSTLLLFCHSLLAVAESDHRESSDMMDGLQLTLIALDSSLPSDTRSTACLELEELFGGSNDVAEFSEKIVYSIPLTDAHDLNGAQTLSSGLVKVSEFFIRLKKVQPLIIRVWAAWSLVDSDGRFLFRDEKQEIFSSFAKCGIVRELVESLASDEGQLNISRFLKDSRFKPFAANNYDILARWIDILQNGEDLNFRHSISSDFDAMKPPNFDEIDRDLPNTPPIGRNLAKRLNRRRAR